MSEKNQGGFRNRRATAFAAALATLGFAGASCSIPGGSTVASTPTTAAYVALGDSYTAGPLIPDQVGSPALCLRSNHNYASLVNSAEKLSSFLDESCSGATTVDMTQSQSLSAIGISLQHNAPQFNALSSSTTLVTIGIGGNDIGFSSIVLKCAELAVTDSTGSPCKNYYTSGGTDQLAATITATAPKIAATLQGIHKLAPKASIYIVGYPDVLPVTGSGCYPTVPIASGDIPYLVSVESDLNQMISAQAKANGSSFVDTYTSSIGHDFCQPTGTKWVEGVVPTSPAAPVHPNALGMVNDAIQVEAAIKAAGK